jgi:proteasome lid subunit RPN8/RPN11
MFSTPENGLDAIEFHLSLPHWRSMISEAKRLAPQEACGLLLGHTMQGQFQVLEVHPVENVYKSPYRYRMDPQQQIQVFLEMEQRDLQLVGIYHSHPTGPDHPSAKDIQEAYYPEAVYLILSPQSENWRMHAYLIRENKYFPVNLKIGDVRV